MTLWIMILWNKACHCKNMQWNGLSVQCHNEIKTFQKVFWNKTVIKKYTHILFYVLFYWTFCYIKEQHPVNIQHNPN